MKRPVQESFGESDTNFSESECAPAKARRTTSPAHLVKRTCKCAAGNCFLQFAGCESKIQDARRRLNALSPEMRDIQLELLLNLGHRVPDTQGQIVARGADTFGESDSVDAGDSTFQESDVETHVRRSASLAHPAHPRKRYRQNRESAMKGTFAGQVVCVWALQKILAVGDSTAQLLRRGGSTRRPGSRTEPKHRTIGVSMLRRNFAKWPSVLLFLWTMYHHCAEGLPDGKIDMDSFSGKGVIAAGENQREFRERAIHKAALDLGGHGRTLDDWMAGPGFMSGPLRYVQHSSAMQLFWEYVGTSRARGQTPASWSTFWRVFSRVFGHKIRFRKVNQHAQCTVCAGLKEDIKYASSIGERTALLDRYFNHIYDQWADRMVWWAIAELSTSWQTAVRGGSKLFQGSVGASVLAIIIDGCDQAKFRIPRWSTNSRKSHAVDRLHRPCLHVAAAWAMGCTLQFFVADEDLPKDSTTQCEMMARTIDVALALRGQLPLGLHIQADNTCREGKNVYVIRWLAVLVLTGVCRWATMGFLRTGHSHENIDNVFAQVVHAIANSQFQTPDDVVDIIGRLCRTVGGDKRKRKKTEHREDHQKKEQQLRSSVGKLYATATRLGQTACWKEWGARLDFKLTGHAVKGAPHYIRICRREDVGLSLCEQGHDCSAERSARVDDFESGVRPTPDDIMLVTKRWLADTEQAQVVALIPARHGRSLLQGSSGAQPAGVAKRRPLLKATVDNLKKNVPVLVKQGFVKAGAAAYLLAYANGEIAHAPRPTTYKFLNWRWRKPRAGPAAQRQYEGEEPLRGVRVTRHLRVHGALPPGGDENDDESALYAPVAECA